MNESNLNEAEFEYHMGCNTIQKFENTNNLQDITTIGNGASYPARNNEENSSNRYIFITFPFVFYVVLSSICVFKNVYKCRMQTFDHNDVHFGWNNNNNNNNNNSDNNTTKSFVSPR